MEAAEPSSPRIFAPSSLTIDDSKLCFNKNHFARPDFDVQRFMNLARRRAGLEQIQKDLRLYLKSVQHSMIELINDDYADFVHLSSNLVQLQSSIDKIDKDLQTIWLEFETSTGEAVGTAEQIELRCEQLASNRKRQTELRDRIAFLSALQHLQHQLSQPSSNILWLEKVASYVVDLTSYEKLDDLGEGSKERQMYKKTLAQLEQLLCAEGVKSANTNCAILPLVLSVLSLTKSTHSLTAALVADYLHPRLVTDNGNHHHLVISVLDGVVKTRKNWEEVLGIRFAGHIKSFLDQTLLTFVLTFMDKCLGMVIVPTDTKLFHKCFLVTEKFVNNWPFSSYTRPMLKNIRDKFNFLVYFKLVTYKLTRQIDANTSSEKFSLEENERVKCSVSSLILQAIETVWSEDVFLMPLIDKMWDFTLKMLAKHISWTKHVIEAARSSDEDLNGISRMKVLLYVRYDLKIVHSTAFDLALEHIWTKLGEIGVETTLFGQCLTRLGSNVDAQCTELDKIFMEITAKQIAKEFDAVSDIPKQYRWTRKPVPSVSSPYISSALSQIEALEKEIDAAEMEPTEIISKIVIDSFKNIIQKSIEVIDSANVHNTSRLLRKQTNAGPDGVSDQEKMKIQVFYDLDACSTFADRKEIVVDGLRAVIERCRPDSEVVTSNMQQNGSSASLSENSFASNDNTFLPTEITPNGNVAVREGSA